ncbi:CDP-glycerol glycerophosphotransferase family protein [Lederbergia wuyishanensis]|uniref:CDP-ribitol ribitolphosphotransferase n=1 Tax=Lederbergia wuyishanensis TaxID=1347903 RepID=A0ABU0D347_9BACI|nr:CDP-glycerol glycerophosphotransferase family protein [Lederbergia wuyishanensis]MCJ8007996.1 CDP-glycerol glycerophosphotransferase family protein [Lederbergia wuyishanensis]MDQ0342833.1 CDP-ribitol ribitolphosphotransferase [Lederbergia wuyishanensis]
MEETIKQSMSHDNNSDNCTSLIQLPKAEQKKYFEDIDFEITSLNWNGSILKIKGYSYIQGISLTSYSNIRKKLLLINEDGECLKFVLEDIRVSEVETTKKVDGTYQWAGFTGIINFSKAQENKPLLPGKYQTYIELEYLKNNQTLITRRTPLGDIRKFLKNNFHSTQMEFFSSKNQIVDNLMVTYDVNSKSMLLESIKIRDINPSLIYGDIKNKTRKPGLIYRIFRSMVFQLLYYLFHVFPVKTRRILFASDSREEIGGNLKFVYEEMVNREIDFDYKFMFKENSFVKKSLIEIVKLAYYCATSKNILLEENYPMISPLKIRKKADLIQLWHGAGAFKKFGYSRLGQPGGPKINSKDHRNYTKAVVSTKNVATHYAESFDIEKDRIYPLGVPRTDIFFDEEYKEQKKIELYEKYPFLKDKKVILFAPTFRGRGRKEAHYPMEYLNFEKLYNNLKDEYVFLFKLHFIILNKITIPYQYSDFFYDFSEYREVNDLLLITDLLITDYSSICFEFSLLDKPMLFFAYDVEEYISKRGFYYEYQSFIPGNLVKTTNELVEKIVNKDFAEEKIKPFRDYFFDHKDGKASQRVVDELILSESQSFIRILDKDDSIKEISGGL